MNLSLSSRRGGFPLTPHRPHRADFPQWVPQVRLAIPAQLGQFGYSTKFHLTYFPEFRVSCTRRLQPFRYLHSCSGCFRLERIAGWGFHPGKRRLCTAHTHRRHSGATEFHSIFRFPPFQKYRNHTEIKHKRYRANPRGPAKIPSRPAFMPKRRFPCGLIFLLSLGLMASRESYLSASSGG